MSTQVLLSDATHPRQDVAILDPPGVVHARLSAAGVGVTSLAGPGGLAGASWRLSRLLARGGYDVLESYGFRAGLVARAGLGLALPRRPPRLVIGVRGLHFTEAEEPNGRKTRLVLAIERLLSPTVAQYDANSHGARSFLISHGFSESKMTVIVNGVDADVPTSRPADVTTPVIVCTARFVPRKRHDVLLAALALLRDGGVDFRCELIGYGPTLETARRRCVALGLEGHVTFLGRQSQSAVTERLAEGHIFVLNSLWEGMPGGVLEAMAAGLPVVGTDVNGTNEVVIDGETGLLVLADDPTALAAALGRLIADPAERGSMGTAGRLRITSEFSFANVVRSKASLYRTLARDR